MFASTGNHGNGVERGDPTFFEGSSFDYHEFDGSVFDSPAFDRSGFNESYF